jgi:hypothetical protein
MLSTVRILYSHLGLEGAASLLKPVTKLNEPQGFQLKLSLNLIF